MDSNQLPLPMWLLSLRSYLSVYSTSVIENAPLH
uniref:Uncharacterized protein n=2 Tax=Viruses TaxID=10239 RepID=A0A8D9UHQ8_9VIRU|nr:MAG TPA: hypothetical protein [Bacteriophage sp.]DAE13177.1 MAG TPA: hypothetical protein [Siphoviridae sp. ctLqe90]